MSLVGDLELPGRTINSGALAAKKVWQKRGEKGLSKHRSGISIAALLARVRGRYPPTRRNLYRDSSLALLNTVPWPPFMSFKAFGITIP